MARPKARPIDWTRRAVLLRALPMLGKSREDIRQLCKVSRTTFNRAINGDGRVSEIIFHRIEAAVLPLARDWQRQTRTLGERQRKPEFWTDLVRAWRSGAGEDFFTQHEIVEHLMPTMHPGERLIVWMHMHQEPAWSDDKCRYYVSVLAERRFGVDTGATFDWITPVRFRSNTSWPKDLKFIPTALRDWMRLALRPEEIKKRGAT